MKTLNLPEHLFWDYDIAKLDKIKNKRIIIERVFTRGDISEIKTVIQFYGINLIKQEIKQAGFLDKKTLNWLSLFLNIPKKEFLCYTKIQSKQIHWNF